LQSRGNSVLNAEYISRGVLHLLDSLERKLVYSIEYIVYSEEEEEREKRTKNSGLGVRSQKSNVGSR